ncbi:MAG: FAD:protein FMN transferase [Verrucomicrobiae bacterium]|nr:FAD:protein FMN transferase [Verrucomicrobiae bacterium]
MVNTIDLRQTITGSEFSVTITEPGQRDNLLESLSGVVMGRIARVLSLLDSRDPGSDINRLNACGHIHPMRLHPWVYELIEQTLLLGDRTKGAFDVAAEPSRIGLRFIPHLQAKPGQEAASFRDVCLLGHNRVRFRKPLRIDLSGIDRAFAIDKAIELLIELGVSSATIRTQGHKRSVGIVPDTNAAHSRNRATVTQPAYHANGLHHWRKIHHIAHPRHGRPMRSIIRTKAVPTRLPAALH